MIWDNIKYTKTYAARIAGKEEREKRAENLFEKIIAENSSKLEKETYIQVQEYRKFQRKLTQRGPH